MYLAPCRSGLGAIRGLIVFERPKIKTARKENAGSLEHQMKIASMEDPFPRGTLIGKQVAGRPLSEAEHSRKRPMCGG